MAEDKPTTLLFRVPDIGFSNYAHNIPDEEIHQDKGGREEDPHVSVLVGLKNENPESVRKVVENYNLGPVDVSFGEISVFENDGYDVLKVEAEGKELRRLHRIMADELSHENRFPDYKPHVTIAYMQSGEGKKYEGDNPFEGKTVTLQKLLYSNSKETKVPIMLDMDKASKVFRKLNSLHL